MASEQTPLLVGGGIFLRTDDDVAPATEDEKPLPGRSSFLAEILESKYVHWTVIGLTLCDLVIVFAEIVFSIEDRCGGEKKEEPWVMELLHVLSTGILVLFIVEILLRFYVFGSRYFTSSGLHFFDASVVILSLVLDLTLKGWAEEIFGLLILLRGWRVVRVIDGVAMTLTEEDEAEIKKLRQKVKQLEQELQRMHESVLA
ncbi:Voltage-gated hydrogen channel 1 [Irineochytrium annulatum]|nr:Voltage-gated hydrogen channel 1 [Irineochytrium annulatum]